MLSIEFVFMSGVHFNSCEKKRKILYARDDLTFIVFVVATVTRISFILNDVIVATANQQKTFPLEKLVIDVVEFHI